MRKIVIHTKTSEKTGVIIEQNEVTEYVSERPGSQLLSGSIFVGKVMNIERSLQAAFVNIGEKQHAFLRKSSIPWASETIEKTIKEGDYLFVQVIKEAIGTKGAQVTADVTIPGLYTIYQPYGKKVLSSKKLNNEDSNVFREKIEDVLSDQEGCIIRTAATRVGMEPVLQEVQLLKDSWETSIAKKLNKKKPGVVWQDDILPNQLIRKYPVETIEDIILDSVEVSHHLKNMFPSLADRIKWKNDSSDELLFSVNQLQEELVQKVLELEGGVQLVIEMTEAMNVIDVNSHKYKGKSLSNSQAFEVNKQAAVEIQKQMKLRNLSGMIIIDFINMNSPSLEKRLINDMRSLLKQDPIQTNVLGMTRLGLMELTRKRVWPSPVTALVQEQQTKFSDESLLYRLERDLLSYPGHSEAILLALHPRLVDVKKRLLSGQFSSKIPQELFVRQDSTIQGYQIELEGSEDMIREAIEHRGYHVDNLF